jgi:hypothetical protein
MTGGKMTFSVGRPSGLVPIYSIITDPASKLDGGLNILSYSAWDPYETQAVILDLPLLKTNSNNGSITSLSQDQVFYIYVDRDCTITTETGK